MSLHMAQQAMLKQTIKLLKSHTGRILHGLLVDAGL